jgi:hypothetical protein
MLEFAPFRELRIPLIRSADQISHMNTPNRFMLSSSTHTCKYGRTVAENFNRCSKYSVPSTDNEKHHVIPRSSPLFVR